MKINNSFGLPRAIVNAVTPRQTPSERRDGADISVTELIGPPRIRQLKKLYGHLIEVDVVDRIWLIRGSAMHDILSKSADSTSELRLFGQAQGHNRQWTISGQVDLIEDHVLWDYKETKWAAVENGPRQEWIEQLNVYHWLCLRNSIKLAEAKILVTIKDHSPVLRYNTNGYPPKPMVVFPIRLWNKETVESFIQVRLTAHEAEMPECTEEERWAKPTQYALCVDGGKKALALYKTQKEASEQRQLRAEAMRAKRFFVQERKAESIKCKYFCDVWQFCPVGRQERGTEQALPEPP